MTEQQHPDLLLDLSKRYERSAEISSEVRLYWTLHTSTNASGGTIDLAVSYRLPRPLFHNEHYDDEDENDSSMNMNGISMPADDAYYWLGFGLTPQGGMVGADMFLYLPPPPPPNTRSRNYTKAEPTAAEEKTKGGGGDGILIDAHASHTLSPGLIGAARIGSW